MRGHPLSAESDHALSGPWFVPMTEAAAPVRVLGFPHAGAGCAAFAGCVEELPPGVGLWALNLPGRQARFSEPSITDLDLLVDAVVRDLPAHPYVLLGYCSGALLAFLVARAAADRGLLQPRALIVASYPAPHLARPAQDLHELPSADFWERIQALGGFPPVLARQPDFRAVFEPALRADYAAMAAFRYRSGPPLSVPIVAVAGERDDSLPEAHLHGWAEQTSAGFRLELVDGDHWLLEGGGAELMRVAAGECGP
ncbi:thioesterase II family protein [Cryptosporangium sp. NPDC051539]|uniref:thioesterase II family protein n=1 Tax=Cryptosporangium sp. NPDC051539 TaxID=3363962 RepID=UPI00379F30EE